MRLMKDSTDGIFDEIKNTKLMLGTFYIKQSWPKIKQSEEMKNK